MTIFCSIPKKLKYKILRYVLPSFGSERMDASCTGQSPVPGVVVVAVVVAVGVGGGGGDDEIIPTYRSRL